MMKHLIKPVGRGAAERAGGWDSGPGKRQAAKRPLSGSPPHHRWFSSLWFICSG